MNENNNKAYFIGGFKGVKKETNRPYWFLAFGAAQEQTEDRFGGAAANIYVDEKVYNDFKAKAKPFNYVDAQVLYVRGGWSLINYKL